MIFTAGDQTYEKDKHGVVHQLRAKPYRYDAAYSATYDTPAYTAKNELLQAMRLTFATAVHGRPITHLCDVGYGNGAFLKFAQNSIPLLCGCDVTDVPLPNGILKIDGKDMQSYYGVLTFWDCLEHIPDLSFLSSLCADAIIISLPHYPGEQMFADWCHRKPDEHLHHFDAVSIHGFMHDMGWKCIAVSDHEDIVRKRPDTSWNILSAGFKRF